MNRAAIHPLGWTLGLALCLTISGQSPIFAHELAGKEHGTGGGKGDGKGEKQSQAALAAEMAQAATNLWKSLTPDQQKKASFEMKDDERLNWHFIPKERKGLPLKEMTPAQQHLAHAFLSQGLSQRGYAQAGTIMSLEAILKELEKSRPKPPNRDPEMYFFSIFGTPDAKATWGWRVEGHHLSLNFTINGGQAIAATPAFMGSNPGEVRDGPRQGLRVLGPEEESARAIVKSLSEEQRKTAIVATEAPKDIISAAERKIDLGKINGGKPGIAVSALNPQQREMLLNLIDYYAHRHRGPIADQELRDITAAAFENVHFAWAGGLERGEKHYYRIHGPTFLIEYDNTQDNANHVHSVWRDPKDDFGEDLLKRHYEQDHQRK